MEQINTIELKDENIYPDDKVLEKVLGESYAVYGNVLKLFDENEMMYEWRYYKDGKAWLCKVQKKKRTIVWMSAWKGFMKAAFYFPEKYVEDLQKLEISEELKKRIIHTKNIGKSKPCMFDITDESIFTDFIAVLEFKLKSK